MRKNKIMTRLLILILLASSCSEKILNRDNYIPLDYQFPIKKIGEGKSIYFEKITYNTGIDIKLNLCQEGNTEFLLKTTSNHVTNELIDSTKFTVSGKKIEIYTNFLIENIDFVNLKGKIVEDLIIEDGSKYGVRQSNYVFEKRSRKVTIKELETYLYDTIINDVSELKCIVTQTTRNINYYRNNENVSSESEKEISYYAKGIGLYLIKRITKDNEFEWFRRHVVDNNGKYYNIKD